MASFATLYSTKLTHIFLVKNGIIVTLYSMTLTHIFLVKNGMRWLWEKSAKQFCLKKTFAEFRSSTSGSTQVVCARESSTHFRINWVLFADMKLYKRSTNVLISSISYEMTEWKRMHLLRLACHSSRSYCLHTTGSTNIGSIYSSFIL